VETVSPGSLVTLPFVINPNIPLTKTDPVTGEVRQLLCVKIDGVLHFHPDRMADVRAALANPQPSRLDLERWADDGGTL
jgi:hypothetical protein